jgi:hypothetical protein
MKVLDLQCGQRHRFEGWFGSEDDFQSQLRRGLVACPMCGDHGIVKMLSAPRLNLGTHRAEPEPPGDSAVVPPSGSAAPAPSASVSRDVVAAAAHDPDVQAAWFKLMRHVVDNTEDVGSSFAEEARKIHYGEADERSIRGQATRQETQALIDEGIAVMPLDLPPSLKGRLQ